MDRREFLKSASLAALSSSAVASPAVITSAQAQSRADTLLIVSESGPNNLDGLGVGTTVPGYEASWNCYDRLISYDMKTGENGFPYYDRDKFKPELAEDMNVGKDSVTFKLRKDATFQDGTPVTSKDVKGALDRAVSVGGFPTVQMKAGSGFEFENEISATEAQDALREAPGIMLVDKREDGGYVTPVECVGDYATFVSRIREDSTVENGLTLWCVSDNLRKGAALNAVQIAELLGRRHLKKG